MLRRIVAVGFLCSAALPALAQDATRPAAGAPSTQVAPAGVIPTGPSAPIGFLQGTPPGLFNVDRLKGVEVIGLDIKRIGQIEDVMVDRTGRIAAVVIGVGGFLGIGEKNVAVPFEALMLNFEASPTDGASSSNTGAGLQTQAARNNDPASPGVNTTGAVGTPGVTAGGTGPGAETSRTGGRAVAGGPAPVTAMSQGTDQPGTPRTGMEAAIGGPAPSSPATVPVAAGELQRVMLRATKAELENAPEFKRPR